MSEAIEQLIDRVSTQDFANAQPMFAELMASKLHDAIDAEKIKIAGLMFNGDEEDEPVTDEELDDVDETQFDDEDFEDIPDEE